MAIAGPVRVPRFAPFPRPAPAPHSRAPHSGHDSQASDSRAQSGPGPVFPRTCASPPSQADVPPVPGDPQDVLGVRAAVAEPRGWARPGLRGGRLSLAPKHLALPRPHRAQRAQPVHDEGHVQSSLHPKLGSPSRSWVHFPKDLGCTTAPTGQNWGLLGEKSSRAHAGAERSATAPWELHGGSGSGYHGNTRLFLKPRTRTQLTARQRVLGRVTALLAQQRAAPRSPQARPEPCFLCCCCCFF